MTTRKVLQTINPQKNIKVSSKTLPSSKTLNTSKKLKKEFESQIDPTKNKSITEEPVSQLNSCQTYKMNSSPQNLKGIKKIVKKEKTKKIKKESKEDTKDKGCKEKGEMKVKKTLVDSKKKIKKAQKQQEQTKVLKKQPIKKKRSQTKLGVKQEFSRKISNMCRSETAEMPIFGINELQKARILQKLLKRQVFSWHSPEQIKKGRIQLRSSS